MAKPKIEPMLVRHDSTRPDLTPFEHQKGIIGRYVDEDVIPLFMDMGTGKSFTTLQIAQAKFRAIEDMRELPQERYARLCSGKQGTDAVPQPQAQQVRGQVEM